MKTCKKCNEVKPFDAFYGSKNKNGRTYYSNPCKDCTRTVQKKEENGKCKKCKVQKTENDFYSGQRVCKTCRINSSSSLYFEKIRTNVPKRMIIAAKSRAKNKNLPFNITEDDIVVPTHCPILGFELEISNTNPSFNSPSLDRIIPELGYIKGNVRVISHMANAMKSSATPEQLLTFAKWIIENVKTE